jgi:hypothetical protein
MQRKNYLKFIFQLKISLNSHIPHQPKTILITFSCLKVLIDGPISKVPRQQYPVSQLHLTKFKVQFPFTAPTRVVKKALEDFSIKEKWGQTLWAERAKAKYIVS